jgi:L-asparaginase/Glu-tRNA(Gln) amidotransferase subunit D
MSQQPPRVPLGRAFSFAEKSLRANELPSTPTRGSLSRGTSFMGENTDALTREEPPTPNDNKVLILDAGGTISCIPDENGKLSPAEGVILEHIQKDPQFESIRNLLEVRKALPKAIDSAQITTADWMIIAERVDAGIRDGFRGIVITHGTDTLAYTAAVLTFSFSFLPIPIILTAAQFPLVDPYTDAKNNLYGSCMAAFGTDPTVGSAPCWFFPEVMVFINHRLLLGSRIRKEDANHVDAFQTSIDKLGCWTNHRLYCNIDEARSLVRSRVLKILTQAGLRKQDAENKLNNHLMDGKFERSRSSRLETCKEFEEMRRIIWANRFKLRRRMPDPNLKVALFKLCPTMNNNSIENVILNSMFEQGYRHFVVEAYGSGNGPQAVIDWFAENKNAYGAIVTQCHKGFVSEIYGASFAVTDNVVLCGDMTTECAIAKMWVCGKGKEGFTKMAESLRGEVTGPNKHY